MASKDMRSQNDNLATWRNKKKELTEDLLIKAIKELVSLKAKPTQKNVSEMMDKIASDEDKEYKANITSSAISKNPVLKSIIHEAQAKTIYLDNKNQKYTLDAEKQFEEFKLKAIIAKQAAKIKEFEAIIKRVNITDKKTYLLETPSEKYKLLLEDIIIIGLEDGLFDIDQQKKHLLFEGDHRIVIDKSTLETLIIPEKWYA